jgi:hypothetical protein
MQNMPEHYRGNTSATYISQRLISQWVIKQEMGSSKSFTVTSHSTSAQHHGGPSTNSSSFEEYLHVLVPTKTYSKQSQTSVTEETNQIHSDTSLLSFISPDMFVPAETSAFSKEDASFPFEVGSADSNRCNMQHMVQKSVNLAI